MIAETPMCACGHTRASHDGDGCPACAGPPCDETQRIIEKAYWAGLNEAWLSHTQGGGT